MEKDLTRLSARERQIMEALLAAGAAGVGKIVAELPDPPNDSAVRTMLLRLEEKGWVSVRREGRRNVYSPTIPRREAAETAIRRLIRTYFDDSPTRTVAAILEEEAATLSDAELEELEDLVAKARERGR